MESNYITFYKDNLIENEKNITHKQIIQDFYLSKFYRFYKQGWPFPRSILTHMAFAYGSFDLLTDQQLTELRKELNVLHKK